MGDIKAATGMNPPAEKPIADCFGGEVKFDHHVA
jgi:hypothetical protein